ncbi:MAG: DNA repair protein RecO [Candidatus Promineifilaceae bacterium]|jgi:DNA repair protein RecO (recombination protein O)
MARERTYRTEAIVLKRTDFGEADRLLTLFSKDLGKISAIAKGARKPQSRKTGHVELFMRSKFFIAKGRNLDIITQAEMIDPHAPLREDLIRVSHASYAVELLNRFTVEEDPHPQIYDLLDDTLSRYSETDELNLVTRYYELRLLSLTGFQPRLYHCVTCGEEIQEQDQFFSSDLGGILCPDCRHADPRAVAVSATAVKVMRYLQTRHWDAVKHLHLRKETQDELEQTMHRYILHMLERELKSVDFLHQVQNNKL